MSEREQQLVHEMMDYCFEKDVEYVTDLASYANNNRQDWSNALNNPVVYARMTKHLHAHSEK